ncbi:TonB-dependent receptor [Odoribacter sp. OttesenSCG-928-G04]|nr:TonB-dependent receptor [Odoribacter sp. OttesenSCG-928-G04]
MEGEGIALFIDDTVQKKELEEVTVTGKNRPSALQSSAPLQMMTKEELRRLGYQNLADAVRRFAGVSVKDYGGIGGLKTVSIRNLGANHTAVSYDGVVVSNCQAGQIDIGRFSLDNVETLSLAVGQENNIFQPARMQASAGVLSIKTVNPTFRQDRNYGLQAKVKAGSFGMINPSLRYIQKLTDKIRISLDGNYLRADGTYPFTLTNGSLVTKEKRYNSDIETWHAEANLYCRLNDSSSLNVKAYYFTSERGLPGSITLYNPEQKERLWDQNLFTQVHYDNYFSARWALKAQLKYNYSWNKYEDHNLKYIGGVQTDRHEQQEYYATLTGLFQPLSGLSLSLATDVAYNTLKSNVMEKESPVRYTSQSAFSLLYNTSLFTVQGALLGTYVRDELDVEEGTKNRHRLTPVLSMTIRPWKNESLHFRILYKNTFRVPTFNDLYYLRMGNRDLKPELAREYNVGITWGGQIHSFIDYLNMTLDGYLNEVEDKIVAVPTTYIWKMKNLGKVRISGLDATMATGIPLTKDIYLRLTGAYTYQKAIDITDPNAKTYKKQIQYAPVHSGNGAINIEMPWINISYTVLGVGKRYFLPQNIKANEIDGYVEHTAAVYRTFTLKPCEVRLQAELVNFTNEQYDIIKYYPMAGRSFRLSATINF